MRRLVPLAMPGGSAFVDALRRAWDDGDAVLPVDPRLPKSAVDIVLRALRVDEPVEDGDALVVATSGTTGEPKGVVLTHDALAASAIATSSRLAVDPRDTWLACLPLAHIGGLSVVTRALLTDTPLIVHPGFDVAEVERAADEGVTLVSLVTTALRRIDPARFRMIVLGGSAPPSHRPANVVATYGMTETGSGVVYDGVALAGVECAIDPETDEISLRGPMLLRCYRDGVDPKDSGGWFRTGDAGSMDSDGRLLVYGRIDDMIITGGENVWPEAVERVLATLASVHEVAVVGRNDDEWGQRVVALIVPADRARPPRLDELRDAIKERMGPWAAPRELVVVDALPHTALGKIRRSEL
jgi:O-succinylbenzoic acid--CoA ligase